jgi:DNA-binding MarR family transcriptional regulator
MTTDDVIVFAQTIKAAQQELERRSNEALRPLGLTRPQAEAVLIIGANEPLALRELGELVIAESGHPSRLVDRLVDAGFVNRRVPDDDRRRIELTLTPRGRATVAEIESVMRGLAEWAAVLLRDYDVTAATATLRALLRGSPPAPVLVPGAVS